MKKAAKKRVKPTKPEPDFPLSPAANGQWQKKIRGKVHYFGVWDDPEAARQKYLDEKDDLQAGRTPRTKNDTRLTLAELCNEFLTNKEAKLESGELSIRMFHGYHRICHRLIEHFGKTRIVEELRPTDFAKLRAQFSKGVGLVTLGNRVQHARVVFRYASESDLIDKPLKFGPDFKRPTKTSLRKERQSKPAKKFEANELRSAIDSAKQPLKAMILLAINCAFGQTDCSKLPLKALDLKKGWVDFPRPKSGIERRCPLWPETISALKQAIEIRRTPATDDLADRLFVNKLGLEYVRVVERGENRENGINLDGISLEFNKLLAKLELQGNGRTFYAIRHTFETVGGGSRDQVAVNFLMGHAPASDDMSAVYREGLEDDRLISVVNHVRAWLWPEVAKKSRSRKAVAK